MYMFHYSNKVGTDVVLLHDCPQSNMPCPVKCLLEVNEDMVEILLILQVLFAENSEVENLLCGTASFSKAACSSVIMFSACGLSLLRITFSMTLLGCLMRLIVQ